MNCSWSYQNMLSVCHIFYRNVMQYICASMQYLLYEYYPVVSQFNICSVELMNCIQLHQNTFSVWLSWSELSQMLNNSAARPSGLVVK